MAHGTLRPRWGQPLTGIISFICFFLIAWLTWFIFSDPRGIFKWFPYPFVMYLAMMILVGLWQHMFLGDWPFQNLKQPIKGIVMTIANIVLVWFVIDIIFYRILGIGFNFLSYYKLAAHGKPGMLAQVAIVCFVLIGFYSYPVWTIFFGKWPVQPSNLKQPEAGLAEIGWATTITMFFYVILIIPFFGLIYKTIAIATPWWTKIAGTPHVHWVFGWWEWAIVILFISANVWRMKPWSAINVDQPWKGLISMVLSFIGAYILAIICTKIVYLWVPKETFHILEKAKGPAEVTRFLWLHSAEIAGFTLIPFLIWHHYFDDMCPMQDKDSWGAFFFRTVGVLILSGVSYWFFYYANFGHWGLGNPHMDELAHRFPHGESLLWNFWWIIPLLWDEWFFHKWPFYVADE